MNVLESLNEEIRNASERIRQIADDDENCRLLRSIGIGYYSALLIAAEIGDIQVPRLSASMLLRWTGIVNTFIWRNNISWKDNEEGKQVSQMDYDRMHICSYQNCIRKQCFKILCQDSKEEGKAEGSCSCCIQAAEGSLLGYEGMQEVSWLRG